MKEQVYRDPRPGSYFDKFHERSRTQEPGWIYPFVWLVSYPYLRLVYRLRAQGAEHVPKTGPVILAPNHFSAMDHWFVALLPGRRVRWMAKSQLFKTWPLETFLNHMGVFPVRRGHHDEEAITTAETILLGDKVLVMYVEGGRSRSGVIGTDARPGLGRLALETGAPVVPVAIHGSERARNWRRLQFPQVNVRYGPPLRFGTEPEPPRERQQEVSEAVLSAIRTVYTELSESLPG